MKALSFVLLFVSLSFAQTGEITQIIKVTTLADSGPGSLRGALLTPNSAIVFEVGGAIELETPLGMASDVWVLGSTAPSPGITIQDLGIDAGQLKNIWIENVRIRTGTKYAGGIISDWIKVSEGRWQSNNHNWPRLTNSAMVDSIERGEVKYTRVNAPQFLADDSFCLAIQIDQSETPVVRTGGPLIIQLADDSIDMNDGETIVRLNKSLMPDPLTITNSENVLIEFCSVSHGTDITAQFDNCRNVTVRDCIVAEALAYEYGPKGAHSKGMLFKRDAGEQWNDENEIYRNIFTHNHDRNPRIAHGSAVIANNLIYDHWCGICADLRNVQTGYGVVSIVGNYSIETVKSRLNPWILCDGQGEIYIAENNYWSGEIQPNPWDVEATTTADYRSLGSTNPPSDVPAVSQLPESKLPITFDVMPTMSVKSHLMANAGAYSWARDCIDTRLIDELVDPSTEKGLKTEIEFQPIEPTSREWTIPADPLEIVNGRYRFLDYLKR